MGPAHPASVAALALTPTPPPARVGSRAAMALGIHDLFDEELPATQQVAITPTPKGKAKLKAEQAACFAFSCTECVKPSNIWCRRHMKAVEVARKKAKADGETATLETNLADPLKAELFLDNFEQARAG